jgi:uncharacterized membrane protein
MLKKLHLVAGILVWWIIYIWLYLSKINQFQVTNIAGFLFLSLVPGLLTVHNFRLTKVPPWVKLSLIVGFSLLELMVLGLIVNAVLPIFGIREPLRPQILILAITLLTVTLSIITIKRKIYFRWNILRTIQNTFPSRQDIVFSIIPIVFVLQSILGTTSLNNYGTDFWTMTMLAEIGLYTIVLIRHVSKVTENTISAALFGVGLSLLFMTSLRGWYITGHDIQQEFKVFELTKNAGIWNIAFFRDPYNACMSITILPTIYASLLRVADPYIFKFFFQFFFALTPVLTYFISRHWFSRKVSLLSSLYFVAFPTFFGDMAFLVRQEVAFLFFGLMLYLIFMPHMRLKVRQFLFVLMGIGVILSHYSTTYTLLLVFGLTVISRPLLLPIASFFKIKTFTSSKLETSKKKITITMLIVLAVLSFTWTSLITNTSQGASRVIKETISAIENGFFESNRSIDAISLISFKKVDQQKILDGYIKNNVEVVRKSTRPQIYINENDFHRYPITALPDERLPITKLGLLVEKTGIKIVPILSILGLVISKLMEILGPIGIIYILFRRSRVYFVESEYYLISLYCLFFVFLNIVLPVLSTEYGVFRALQQSLFIIAPLIVMGSEFISKVFTKLRNIILRIFSINIHSLGRFTTTAGLFSIAFFLAFFLYSTSFISQLFGNNVAMLHLSNAGLYYDTLVTQTTEYASMDWIQPRLEMESRSSDKYIEVQVDKYTANKFNGYPFLDSSQNNFPWLIKKNAFVLLNSATVNKNRDSLMYQGDQVTYSYPIEILDNAKSLIYNNGSERIYR